MSKAKNWVFTLNNYDGLLDPSLWDRCLYCIYQEEIGDNGTPHLQGFMQYSSRVTMPFLARLSGLEQAHFEVANGSPESNIHYCSKPLPGCACEKCVLAISLGGPYVYGEVSGVTQGKRTDLSRLQAALDSGAPLPEIYRSHFSTMSRVEKFAINYRRITTAPRNFATQVWVLCGAPGTGKTRTAWLLASSLGSVYNVPMQKQSGLYWDDYGGQDCVILDEFGGDRCTPKFFNQLCDRYPFTVPIHGGGGHQFVSRYVFLTTNYPPRQWWPNAQAASVGALLRRICGVLKFFRSPPPPPGTLPRAAEGVSFSYFYRPG